MSEQSRPAAGLVTAGNSETAGSPDITESQDKAGGSPTRLPRILELRIHGIANTPPETMLGVPRDEIVSVAGDDLGGFWTYKKPAATEPEAGDRNTVRMRTDQPGRIRTEAYSWGNMVRSGGTVGAAIISVFVQIGWLLTLPFAFCNVAYWTRRITRKTDGDREWLTGPGAGTIRLFALGLTLLLTSAFATVALDLVGTQCFRTNAMCAGLPQIFQLLPQDAQGRPLRLALLSLGVVAVILLLYYITRRTRVRYEAGVRDWAQSVTGPEPGLTERRAKPLDPPLLATSGFWMSTRVGQTTEALHIAASTALIAGLLAWDSIVAAEKSCHELAGFFVESNCSLASMLAASPLETLQVGLATLVVLVATAVTAVTTARSTRWITWGRRIAWTLVILAGLTYLSYLAKVTWGYRPDATAQDDTEVTIFLGLTVVPTVLIALLVIGCIAALWWRHSRHGGWWGLIPLVAMIVLAWSGLAQRVDGAEAGNWAVTVGFSVGAALLLGYVVIAWILAQRNPRSRFEAWGGFGASVTLVLSLTLALLLTCLMIFGMRALLLPATAPSRVENNWRLFSSGAVTDLPDRLTVPAVYELFGVGLVIVFAIVLLVAAFAALLQWLRPYRLLSTPTIAWPTGTSERRRRLDEIRLPGTVVPNYPKRSPPAVEPIEREVQSARRFAAFAQRGEPLVGLLAVCSVIAIFAAILVSLVARDGNLASAGAKLLAVVDAMITASLTVMIGLAGLAVVMAIANAASSKERPLGLLWDILCFFPRAGHPFAPPCYGERAIPELSTRTLDWLETPAESSRRVVLSAHSMGGVLAAATIFATLGQADSAAADARGRLGLVTFGVQLRAYFSRIFPDVLGPDVLGVPPCRGPQLFSTDPWNRQVLSEFRDADAGLNAIDTRYGPSLNEELGGSAQKPPAWRSLWRRTDFIGFPVYSYRDETNPIDRGASETDPNGYLWKVATHSGYQFTLQYRVALNEVIERLDN